MSFAELFAYQSESKVILPKDSPAELSGRVLNVMTLLPTQIYKDGTWKVEPVRGNSALYSSYFFLDQHTDWETHLIAWTGELINKTGESTVTADNIKDDPLYLDDHDKTDLEHEIRSACHSDNIHPVWLLRRDQQRWRRYAENVLWPVFHYIQGEPNNGREEADAWHDYVRFNEVYYNKIKLIYKPGDIIWIHDYYLLLLPQLLRMEFPDAHIGFYMHAPFPSSEYFRCLSKRSQLLDGMLGSDTIAFQSESFQRHFISCCARVLGCEVTKESVSAYGLSINVYTLPIGIDTRHIEVDLFGEKKDKEIDANKTTDISASVDAKVHALKSIYHNKLLIVGRDRLDTVRGVVQKLQAFEMFLYMYPEWRDRVMLIQVSSPGYLHLGKVDKKVTELVNHINNEYGSLNLTPVLHYQRRIAKDEYLALLRVADLSLNTSVRDGMNTTALEFVMAQKYHHSPLILSEFTGTALVLTDAIMVNPWDSVGIAKTINKALLMSNEEKALLEAKLYKRVTLNTIQNWTSNFLSKVLEHTHESNYTPALNRPLLLNNYKASKRRLFLFDYDGTLTPIVRDPAAAIPSARLNSILDTLCADPQNQFWIISGRDQAFLSKWFGDKNVGLSSEHGCFMRDVGSKEWVNLAASFDMSWQQKVEDVFQAYTEKTPGSNIERKKVALTWHYRRSDPELGAFQAEQCRKEISDTIAKEYDVEVMTGKANIEVRPKFLNKGEIVKRLVLAKHGAKQDPLPVRATHENIPVEELPDFMLCIGDDVTDEDMFRSLKEIEKEWHLKELPKNKYGSYGVYPVAVGPASKQTVATAHLNEPSQVLETLGLLAGQVSLFESAGSVELDDRGHIQGGESSQRSKREVQKARELREKA